MPTITYTLRIVVPDEIDADTLAEIEAEADGQDTTEIAKVERWLGGYVDGRVADLSADLPEGFYAKADDHA